MKIFQIQIEFLLCSSNTIGDSNQYGFDKTIFERTRRKLTFLLRIESIYCVSTFNFLGENG